MISKKNGDHINFIYMDSFFKTVEKIVDPEVKRQNQVKVFNKETFDS